MVIVLGKNPPSPFCTPIPSGYLIGRKFVILGSIRSNGNKIAIYFQKHGEPLLQPQDDVPFHIEVRAQENLIVRNSFTNHQWDKEERNYNCPIQIGKFFQMIILIDRLCYRVAINGNHYCDFKHRLPLENVRYIHINRDSDIKLICMENHETGVEVNYPFPKPTFQEYPYVMPVTNGCLRIGHKIFVRGKSTPNAKRITINLQASTESNCDIPFHFDMRFKDNVIVRNHYHYRKWFNEERYGGLPIGPNEIYEIEIHVQPDQYLVKMNGTQFCTFRHRLNIREVKSIEVKGDTTLDFVKCERNYNGI